MSIDNRTEAEKQADLDKAVAQDVAVGMAVKAERAEVNEAIATNVAVGMAEKATAEEARANVYATQNARQAVHIAETQNERDHAVISGAVAQNSARSNATAFWTLLGVVGVSLLLWTLFRATRPGESEVASTPPAVRSTTAAPAPVPQQPRPTAAVPPGPPPAPVVIERRIPVPVDRPVLVPVPVPVNPPAASATVPPPPGPRESAPSVTVETAPTAPTESAPSGEKPLRGYVEPTAP